MKKYISFSLFGNKKKYNRGIVENAIMRKEFYPDWRIRVYVSVCTDECVIRKLKQLGAEVFIVKEKENMFSTMWRFMIFDDSDVDIAIVRDADSRFSEREVVAVEEWLNTSKALHIMRDHPYHTNPILAGMWGANTKYLKGISKLIKLFISKCDEYYGVDEDFLYANVYRLLRRNSCVHDSFFFKEPHSKKFPTKRKNGEFVGEIYDENNLPNEDHRKILLTYERSFFKKKLLKIKSLPELRKYYF